MTRDPIAMLERRTRFSLYLLFAFVMATVLGFAGCATAPAGTNAYDFNHSVANMLQATDVAVQNSRSLLAVDKITPADALKMANTADTVKQVVQLAVGVQATQGDTAGRNKLREAADMLDDLNAQLAKRQGIAPPPSVLPTTTKGN